MGFPVGASRATQFWSLGDQPILPRGEKDHVIPKMCPISAWNSPISAAHVPTSKSYSATLEFGCAKKTETKYGYQLCALSVKKQSKATIYRLEYLILT